MTAFTTRCLAVGGLALLVACSTQEVPPRDAPATTGEQPAAVLRVEGPDWESIRVDYRCEGGVEVQVAYLNFSNGAAFATLLHDGRLHPMQQRVSASGARYIALDEQHSLRWWTKGDQATLRFMEADHEAVEQAVLDDCRAQDMP